VRCNEVIMAASSRSSAPVPSAGARIRSYIASLPAPSRRAIRKLRQVIRAAAPTAVEGFSYRIPCVRLDDRPLVWYAAFRNHCSLYPITAAIRRAHAAALRGYGTSTGTVRLPLGKPIPVALVRRLVRARIAEVRGNRGQASR
jgi:uncharacterized protein YdhG (YjbR/CyaY superfamily)